MAASAHANLDHALFTAFGCRLRISAAADQSGEGAGDCTKSAPAGCTHTYILGDIRIVAGCPCRLLARGEVAVICFLGMTAHLDDGGDSRHRRQHMRIGRARWLSIADPGIFLATDILEGIDAAPSDCRTRAKT